MAMQFGILSDALGHLGIMNFCTYANQF